MNKYLLILLLTVTSCSATKQLDKAHDRLVNSDNPKKQAIPADRCATWYPPVTSTNTVIKYVQGKIDTVTGEPVMVYVDCDSVVMATLDEVAKKHVPVNCPPNKIITHYDTITVTRTIQIENTARIVDLNLKLQSATSDRDKFKSEKLKWETRAWWTWGILILLLILVLSFKFLKPKF